MKKLAATAVLLVMAVVLTACATPSGQQVKVKCPACGYEFLAPADN